jgi:ketosteroid isomerase-like protein
MTTAARRRANEETVLTMTGDTEIEELIRGYFAAVADGRWDDVLALFHPDAVLNVAGVSPKLGHERIRPFYENIGARFDRYAPTVNRVLAEGTAARGGGVAILVLNAVNRAGEPIEVHTADDFEIEDGRIRSLRIIFDTRLMR